MLVFQCANWVNQFYKLGGSIKWPPDALVRVFTGSLRTCRILGASCLADQSATLTVWGTVSIILLESLGTFDWPCLRDALQAINNLLFHWLPGFIIKPRAFDASRSFLGVALSRLRFSNAQLFHLLSWSPPLDNEIARWIEFANHPCRSRLCVLQFL